MWYRTGTISLTNGSTAVTGSGTAWISNAAVGEALLAPDGKLYEIANVASDTSITLGSSYLGTPQSGQAYVIVPSQSYIRDLAAQAAALVNNYSTFYNTVGQGKFPDGAVATPAISFSNDTNTGLYRSAADEVTLVANGVAIAKWDTSGFSFVSGVSTITADSTSPALKITQTGTGNALVVEDSASTDSTPFVIDPSGRVFIGATSGVDLPDYSGAVRSPWFEVIAETYAQSSVGIICNPSAAAGSGAFNFAKSRGTNAAPNTIVANNDFLGVINFLGNDGTAFIRGASIQSYVDGTPGPNDMPGRLVFSTTPDNSSTPVERMRITSAGDVLFGSPTKDSTGTISAPYQINAGNGTGASLGQYAWSASAGACPFHTFNKSRGASVGTRGAVASGDELGNIYFAGDDGTNFVRGVLIRAIVDGTPSTGVIPGAFVISTTAASGGSPAERLRIDSSGNVLVKSAAGLGYGTGAGGTVTQVTSKSTSVALNKPTGQITMNNAALAAGAEVGFGLNNSVMTSTDTLLVAPQGALGSSYSTRVVIGTAGASIYVKNITAGSLSDAVVLNFVVIKGSVS